ncbi:hypothetical protein [Planktothricoides sp. SR001]|uniref:hypothetical protein n=1 Tax=Planktothricoides sp. SR001 TaxID=1705388 RepID=UPI0006C87B7C|nr:hypothetical protein [Planktothricoides sp. SR001]
MMCRGERPFAPICLRDDDRYIGDRDRVLEAIASALRMQYPAGCWRRSQFNLGHDVSGCLPKAKVFNMAIALG